MAAVMNGVMLHGGFRPFGGTFLTFSDYARNGVRMSALMKLPVVYVFTHDSMSATDCEACSCVQYCLNVQFTQQEPIMHTSLRQNYVPKPVRAPVWLRRIWAWL